MASTFREKVLRPAQRHGDRGAGTAAQAVAGDRGRGAVVAQIVDEDPATPRRLGERGGVAVRAVGRHGTGEAAGERLGLVPTVTALERHHQVQPLAAPVESR